MGLIYYLISLGVICTIACGIVIYRNRDILTKHPRSA